MSNRLQKALIAYLAIYLAFLVQVIVFCGPNKEQKAACARICQGVGTPHCGKTWPLFWVKSGYCYCQFKTETVDLDSKGNGNISFRANP